MPLAYIDRLVGSNSELYYKSSIGVTLLEGLNLSLGYVIGVK